jgi:hypothetical protein
MAEIAFEKFGIALEATRGTLVDPPTHLLPWAGTLTPQSERYYPNDQDGTLAEHRRSATVRKWASWDVPATALDTVYFPLVCEMALRGGVTPTTPGGGTTARLWTYTPTMDTDTIKTASAWWGDPNVQAFSSPFVGVDEFTVSADTAGTEGATLALKGMGAFPAKDTPASWPAALATPILIPQLMQLWIDTSSAFGTTEINDARLIAAQFKLATGVTRKWTANGPTSTMSFTRMGRAKRHAEMMLRFEVPDANQFDAFTDTFVKARLRLNGPVIEAALRHYVEFDIYGPLTAPSWGELEGSNRTLEFTILSHYETGMAADFAIKVQNNRATL